MSSLGKNTVRHFVYDPLDRVIGVNATLLFYNQNRLATEIEGGRTRQLFEYDAQPLALQQDGATCALLATDMPTSVLHSVNGDGTQQALAYTPFGHHPSDVKALHSISGFNGERPDPVTGHYLLGQGYRAFNPVLMRFNSPDSLSPFDKGGINAYGYCGGDPINKVDPTGHTFAWIKKILRPLKLMKRSKTIPTPVPTPHELLPSTSPKTNAFRDLANPATESPPAYFAGKNFKATSLDTLDSPPPPYMENPPDYKRRVKKPKNINYPNSPLYFGQVRGLRRPNTNNSVLIAAPSGRASEQLSREQIRRNRLLLIRLREQLRNGR